MFQQARHSGPDRLAAWRHARDANRSISQEGLVSKRYRFLLLLITLAVPMICVAADGYQRATIVAVEKRMPATTYFRDSPSEAPLAANRVSYDIAVQMQCTVYVGRYRSEMNYLPAEFVANHPVDV